MQKKSGAKIMEKSSPNFTNNIRRVFLQKITYPQDNFESYYLSAQTLDDIYRNGEIPEILVEGLPIKGPKIAVILALEKHPEREAPDYSMHPDYIDAAVKAGGYPVLIAYDKVEEQLDNFKPDGVLLIGGDFAFPPEWYSTPPVSHSSKRAEAYLKICDYAKEHRLPTLGICAGHQILAGYCHGKLRAGINTGASPENSHRRGGYIIAHGINIEKGSLLYKIIGKERLMVNTAHNEEVTRENTGGFKITATADDGVIEAIEPKQPWHRFVLGVQWHPERLVKLGDKDNLKLFETLVKESSHD